MKKNYLETHYLSPFIGRETKVYRASTNAYLFQNLMIKNPQLVRLVPETTKMEID